MVDYPDYGSGKERENQIRAIRQIGTNGLPTLIRMLHKKDNRFEVWWVNLIEKQHVIKIRFQPAEEIRMRATWGFNLLGSQASGAVPELIGMFEQEPSLRSEVVIAIGNIGPEAEQAIPVLLQGITDTNVIVRNNSINALGHIHAEPGVVVPNLARCLQDSDSSCQKSAMVALRRLKQAAKPAVPALINALTNSDLSIREDAKMALKEIDPKAAADAGIN
jgi:HEAT repeat protein